MTHADAIDKATARLAVCFQRHIDAATVTLYREVLLELPLWAVEQAERALRKRGGDFFPTSARWHQDAAALVKAEQQRLDKLALLNPAAATAPHCPSCRDFGFRTVLDAEGDERVLRCECVATNPEIQRRDADQRVAGEAQGPSPAEAKTLTEQVHDFKRIGSGE